MIGALDEATAKDVYKTLFGMGPKKMKKNADRTYGALMHIDVNFCEEATKNVVSLTLVLPAGKLVAEREDWEALVARLAATLSEQTGKTYRAATIEEVIEFARTAMKHRRMLEEPIEGEA